MSASSSLLASPFSGSVADPFAGDTEFGFEIPQGNVGELESAAGRASAASLAFDSRAADVRRALALTTGGWSGPAASAFTSYAGHLVSVFASNSEVLARAADLLSGLARELEHAQQVTRQAAAQCARLQAEFETQSGLAGQHGEAAESLYAQASAAAHPKLHGELVAQARAAEGEHLAAAEAAASAQGELKFCQKRGRDADTGYSAQAGRVAQELAALEGQLGQPDVLGGGAPVPVAVTPADEKLALAALPRVAAIPASEWSRDPGEALRELTGGRPVTPGQVLALKRAAEREHAKGKGSIVDGLGGLAHTLTFGAVSFGDPLTSRYKGGQLAAFIPIDPESLVLDGDRGAGLVEGSKTDLTPGGGLQFHEDAGGHTLERHVETDDSDLIQRFAEDPRLKASSTFTTRAAAEEAIGGVIRSEAGEIRSWLAGPKATLPLAGRADAPIGRLIKRGSTESEEVSGIRVVLLRDPAVPDGYRILTAFPTP